MAYKYFLVISLCLGLQTISAAPSKKFQKVDNDQDRVKVWDKDHMHPAKFADWINPPYEGKMPDWNEDGKRQIQLAEEYIAKIQALTKYAKNTIFIMGDGMGISTISAARVFMAQKYSLPAEESFLSWEKLPNMALSRTYSAYEITADSAATATAMMCGEKTANSIICANQQVRVDNCSSMQGNEIKSVLHEAMDANKWTGVVSTARITHASPACTFAHSPERNWEADTDMDEDDERVGPNDQCTDIAHQLIFKDYNKNIKVILGGGRENFYLSNETDPEYSSEFGRREDINLIQAWSDEKESRDVSYKYVTNKTEFDSVDPKNTDYLLGLFEPSHMQYEADRDVDNEPSLAQLVKKSIEVLEESPDGYFLFVESGRIDHAHHGNKAYLALQDTVAMSEAVEMAMNMTNEEDTLIIVTADHSHVFTISGYPDRNTDILTLSSYPAADDKPFGILSYGNGPGFLDHRTLNGSLSTVMPRMDLTGMEEEMKGKNWTQDAAVYLTAETHGGEDVGIFARGPMAHLFHGVQEQSYIAHLIRYAMCMGEYAEEGNCPRVIVDAASGSKASCLLVTILTLAAVCLIH